jgi:hypothetical protein
LKTKCRKPEAEYIYDRMGKNNCKFFKFRHLLREEKEKKDKPKSPRAEQKDRASQAKERLHRLFNI